ncbi:response regulator [Undibacterium cyanobacteriorum]|uniref:Response regulator n=1 Tax=Undibacterium cyanobacteriorum TaxID=3073561 RepID=A0ABY9RPK2_9BURK|nr:response regulator [Undibacterium sp. 20NA77.5]WMW82362.1 response regulator [Undibacterium sp. 20NA77.5]
MRAMIIEDSRLAREGLMRMLTSFEEIELVASADNATTALQAIEEHRPDLLFLDIHMPGEDGFSLLAQLDYQPKIIFTTAHSEYAIRSFDFDTIDYLVKPISQTRLAQAIAKLSHTVPTQESSARRREEEKQVLEPNSKIFIKDGNHCHLISVTEIDYIESCKNYVQVFFKGQRAYLKKSISSVEERLPCALFFRANRQHLINLQAIVGIEESMQQGYIVTLKTGVRLEISRRNAQNLKEVLSL